MREAQSASMRCATQLSSHPGRRTHTHTHKQAMKADKQQAASNKPVQTDVKNHGELWSQQEPLPPCPQTPSRVINPTNSLCSRTCTICVVSGVLSTHHGRGHKECAVMMPKTSAEKIGVCTCRAREPGALQCSGQAVAKHTWPFVRVLIDHVRRCRADTACSAQKTGQLRPM